MTSSPHLPDDVLRRFADGTLEPARLLDAGDHLAACGSCRDRALILSGRDARLDVLAAEADGPGNRAIVESAGRSRWASRRWTLAAAAAATVVLATALWLARPVPVAPPARQAVAPAPRPVESSATPTEPSPDPVLTPQDTGPLMAADRNGIVQGLEGLGGDERALVARVLAGGNLEIPAALGALTAPPDTLMGTSAVGGRPDPLSPLGTVVSTDRPAFRWQPVRGATGYTVSVFDLDFRLVASSQSLTTTTWTSPALPAGAAYTWQVAALVGGEAIVAPEPPAAEARFIVADESVQRQIAAARGRAGGSRLAAAVLLASFGALDDAEREAAALMVENPGSPEAERLLTALRAARDASTARRRP